MQIDNLKFLKPKQKIMKKLLTVLAILSLFATTSCLKEKDDPLTTICIVEPETSQAKAQFDNSNYGYYKGVFVGGVSGIIRVNVNNDNTISAQLGPDHVIYNFTTTQTIQEGQPATVNFVSESNSFTFTVAANGSNPAITNLILSGHADVAALVVKETSNAIVMCFEGTYIGGEKGIFNAIIYDDQVKALMANLTSQSSFIMAGTISNNQITVNGILNSDPSFHGILSENNSSGNWNNTLANLSGTWSGERTF